MPSNFSVTEPRLDPQHSVALHTFFLLNLTTSFKSSPLIGHESWQSHRAKKLSQATQIIQMHEPWFTSKPSYLNSVLPRSKWTHGDCFLQTIFLLTQSNYYQIWTWCSNRTLWLSQRVNDQKQQKLELLVNNRTIYIKGSWQGGWYTTYNKTTMLCEMWHPWYCPQSYFKLNRMKSNMVAP